MKFKYLIATLGLTCMSSAFAASTINVGVVDMDSIFKGSTQVKAESLKLTQQFSKRRASLMQMEQNLQKGLTDLQKNSAVMSKKQLTAKRSDVQQQEASLRQAQQKFQADVMAAQNKAMAQFMLKVRKAAADLAAKNHLAVILPKNAVLYAASNTDLTAQLAKDLASTDSKK